MVNLQTLIQNYLNYCESQKRLDAKTLKAYRIDLKQFSGQICVNEISEITPDVLEGFIAVLHKNYKPKTVKRKIAAVKAFFHYLEYSEYFLPFHLYFQDHSNNHFHYSLPNLVFHLY